MKHFKLVLGILAIFAGNLHAAAIHRGARMGSSMLVQGQLSKGVSPDARDKHGNTPLHYVRNKRTATILIVNGADVNAKNNDGVTPLHLVPLKSTFFEKLTGGLSNVLLKNGADPNVKDNGGNTPLHDAARFGQVKMIGLLLKHGANPDTKNVEGLTPLHAAVALLQTTKPAVARNAALGIGAPSGTFYYLASRALARSKWEAAIRTAGETKEAALQKIAGFFAESTPWPPPTAGNLKELDIKRIYDSAVSDANATFQKSAILSGTVLVGTAVLTSIILTIIMVDIFKRNRTVQKLIDGGGDVNAIDNLGNTPLHLMAAGRKLTFGKRALGLKAARTLLASGANVLAKNDAGYTPYAIARRNYRFILARTLKERIVQ